MRGPCRVDPLYEGHLQEVVNNNRRLGNIKKGNDASSILRVRNNIRGYTET